jgi:hypothetical protein
MANISLEGSIRTCKVDTADAIRMESDRFLNPYYKLCPNWTGTDLTGRPVCADSFYTKRAGCDSSLDRVNVENVLRPQYSDYIGLDARGILGDNLNYNDNLLENEMQNVWAQTQNLRNITGDFGQDLGKNLRPSCSLYPDQMVHQEDFVRFPRPQQQQQQQRCAGRNRSRAF